MKALRKKYCDGIVSDFYMETGIPLIEHQRREQSDEDIKRLLRENEKNVKEAIKNASKASGRKLKEEDRIVFI